MRDWTPEAEAAWRDIVRLWPTARTRDVLARLAAFAAEVARATRAEAARAALEEAGDPPPPGADDWTWGYAAGRRDAADAIGADDARTPEETIAARRLADATCAWEDAEVAELGAAAVSARYAELLAARDAYRAARGTP